MRSLMLATLAVSALAAGGAYAQSNPQSNSRSEVTNGPIATQGGLSTRNSINTTGPATRVGGEATVVVPVAPSSRMYGDTSVDTGTSMSSSIGVVTVASAPVPDTAENRRLYGQPMSNAGKRSAARGN